MSDVEKDILNRYTELCIRKKDRGREIRKDIDRRSMDSRYPEFRRDDVKLEDEKTMEDMLNLYMKKENLLRELVQVLAEKNNVG